MALKLLDGLIVRPDPRGRYDHWQGGPPIHKGAQCKRCRKPLQLIWNLDASDPRFVSKSGKPLFRDVSRLALYWCIPCLSSIDYQLTDDKLELICVDGAPAERAERKRRPTRFPYPNYPKAFDRRRIGLYAFGELPKIVQRLLTDEKPPELTPSRQKLLEKHVGHRVFKRTFDLAGTWVHQFGGRPYLPQGDMEIVCRNANCRSHGKRLHILAAINNDPPNGLPFIETLAEVQESKDGWFNYFFTVYFHICKSCLSIHAHNQCD